MRFRFIWRVKDSAWQKGKIKSQCNLDIRLSPSPDSNPSERSSLGPKAKLASFFVIYQNKDKLVVMTVYIPKLMKISSKSAMFLSNPVNNNLLLSLLSSYHNNVTFWFLDYERLWPCAAGCTLLRHRRDQQGPRCQDKQGSSGRSALPHTAETAAAGSHRLHQRTLLHWRIYRLLYLLCTGQLTILNLLKYLILLAVIELQLKRNMLTSFHYVLHKWSLLKIEIKVMNLWGFYPFKMVAAYSVGHSHVCSQVIGFYYFYINISFRKACAQAFLICTSVLG